MKPMTIRALPAALAALSFTALLACAAGAAPSEPPRIAPQGGPWDAGRGFSFEHKVKKTRRSLSGIACPANASGQRLCLGAFDEGGEARYFVLGDGRVAPDGERVILRPGKVELDAEAAATDGAFYYVTGSHSAKRSSCASNPDSRHVIRFKVDPATGRGLRTTDGKLAGLEDTGALWALMATLPGLKDHVGEEMCLGGQSPGQPPNAPDKAGRQGVNIEGLAIRNGRLFFGFRGPAIDGTAMILSVDADALFKGGDARPKLSTITVGQGRGIRDLLAVSDGILVLAGPDDDKANTALDWVVLRWDGEDSGNAVKQPRALATLDLSHVKLRKCDEELKPEALVVTEDRPGQPYRAIILSDGMCDGGALGFSIPR
jgi:hypothetical protein